MPVCEGFEKCTFFKEHMASMPSTAALSQSAFCKSNFSECARYRVFKTLGETAVPSDLSPSESARADRIIAGGR